jgi:hypothetical protein
VGFGTTINAGDLTDRIRLERYAGAWLLDSVVFARVAPGAAPGIPGPDPAAAALERGNAYDVTIRYRKDLTRGMRARWGTETLIVYAVSDLDGRRRWSSLACESFLAYATRHDTLLARVAVEGAAITFTKPTTSANAPATYDSATDTPAFPASVTTVTGVAMALVGGQPTAYAPNTRVETAGLELGFVPPTYGGTLPAEGMLCPWGGEEWWVESVDPVAPDGTAIGARVVLAR